MVVVADMVTVGPDVVDKVWQRWRADNGSMTDVYNRSYKQVSRRWGGKQFEEWLFTEGVIVTQINGEMYLQFLDPDQATFFLLRYA